MVKEQNPGLLQVTVEPAVVVKPPAVIEPPLHPVPETENAVEEEKVTWTNSSIEDSPPLIAPIVPFPVIGVPKPVFIV